MSKKETPSPTHRARTGTKLYAVRDGKSRFKDIRAYVRAHAAYLRRKAKRKSK